MSDIIFNSMFDIFYNFALSEPFKIIVFCAALCCCFAPFFCFFKFKR